MMFRSEESMDLVPYRISRNLYFTLTRFSANGNIVPFNADLKTHKSDSLDCSYWTVSKYHIALIHLGHLSDNLLLPLLPIHQR